MNKRLVTSGGLIAGLALFVALNVISNTSLKSARIDLTENQLYTLSEGSRQIVRSGKSASLEISFCWVKIASACESLKTESIRCGGWWISTGT